MTELKCPVCKTGNVTEYSDPPYYVCDNQYCPSYEETDFTTYDILVDTKKKLDIAVDFIKELDGTRSGSRENLRACNGKTLNAGNGFCWATIDQIHNVLRQINQKEEK